MSSLLALALAFSVAGPTAADPAPLRDSLRDSLRADRDVRLTALRNARSVMRCYEEQGLRRQPELEGVVEVSLTVEPTGVVSEVQVASATLEGPGSRETAACIATIARQWRFERGPFDVEIIVFPFVLRPEMAEDKGRKA
jgi:hypothetical protein